MKCCGMNSRSFSFQLEMERYHETDRPFSIRFFLLKRNTITPGAVCHGKKNDNVFAYYVLQVILAA